MASTAAFEEATGHPPIDRRIRAGVVDEYPSQLAGTAATLDSSSTIRVVMATTSCREAFSRAGEADLDVLLIEPWMRSGDGLACITEFRVAYPDVTVVALSRLWDAEHVAESLTAGAAAHIPKTTPLDDLAALIRQVLSGISVHPPTVVEGKGHSPLTAREREVLRLASKGMANADIARDLFVTEQTVKFHLSNVYRKLGVSNRTEASHRAVRAGIVG